MQTPDDQSHMLSLALRGTKSGIWDWDIPRNIVSFDPNYFLIAGYEPDEFPHTHEEWEKRIHPDDFAPVMKTIKQYLAGEIDNYTVEFRFKTKADDWMWVLGQGEVTAQDEEGNPIRFTGLNIDISQLKNTEKALQKERDFSTSMFNINTTQMIILLLDVEGRIQQINTFMETITGYKEAEVKGKDWFDTFLPPEDHTEIRAMFKKAIADIDVSGEANPIMAKDGRELMIEWYSKTLKDRDGVVVGLLSFGIDISARKRAEEKLRESERKFRLLADFTQDWEYWVNPEGQYVYISPSCEKICGYRPEEFISNPNLLFDITTADYVSGMHQHFEEENLSNTKEFSLELQITAKNGEIRWLEHNCIPIFDEDGNFAGRRGNNRDITERKRGESYLQSIFRSAPVGIGLIVDSKLQWVNRTFEEMLGYPNAELEGKSSRILYQTDEEFEWVGTEKYKQIKKYGTGSVDTQFLRKDGSIIDVFLSSTPLDLNNMASGVVFNALDITDRKRQTKILSSTIFLRQFGDDHSVDELLRKSLDEVEKITGSSIGFLHFVEPDQETLSLQAWSTNTLENMCKALGSGTHYPVSEAGVWVDCVHQRRTMIHNDYLSLPERKGLPEGHAPIIRELVVPVFRDKKIAAILGVGNKSTDYTQKDAEFVEGFADIVWDIVQKKQAEDAKRQSDEKFSRLFKLSPDPISLTHVTDGTYIDVNRSFCKISGWQEKEIIGRSSLDLDLWHREEDRARVVSGLKACGKVDGLELLFQRKDGRIIPGLLSARLIEISGENCILSIIRDITEQKRIEKDIIKAKEEWEATFDAMTDMVTIHDRDMRIVRANKAAHDFFGVEDGQLTGKKCCEAFWGSETTCSGCPLLITMKSGKPCTEILNYNKPDKILQVTTTPIPNDSGKPEYYVHVATDMTEQKQLEKEVSRANRLASLGELAAGIAHEINNPNALILYNSDILETMINDLVVYLEDNPPADSGQLFGGLSYQDVAREVPVMLPTIHDSAQRIKRIVSELRDFSHQDSSVATDIVDVNQAVQAAVRLVHNAIKKATDHFLIDLTEPLPTIIGTTGRLDQVIINLLMNACQALETRAQLISISTAYDSGNGQVQVVVADAGHGMTADVVEHILEPFVTTKREQGGTGLGLSVSARIVRELHGTLNFTSVPGEGTTATIRLPIRKEENHVG